MGHNIQLLSAHIWPYLFIRTHLDVFEVFVRHFQQSVQWPFTEPVDGRAVDKGRVHTDAVPETKCSVQVTCWPMTCQPEGFSHWTHAQNQMQVCSDAVNQVVEHVCGRVINAVLLGRVWQSWTNLKHATVSSSQALSVINCDRQECELIEKEREILWEIFKGLWESDIFTSWGSTHAGE